MSAIFGEILYFPQENGEEVNLRVFGDEDYARYEDLQGYTVVYDRERGKYCYADLQSTGFVSTGIDINQAPPSGIARHLEEPITVKRSRANERRQKSSPEALRHENVIRTFGPNQGLLEGRQLSIGRVRGLTILVNFQDITSTTTAADVTEMLNGNNYTRNGNICSVREYFLRVSNNNLDYTNTVVGPFTLSKNRQHYINNLLVEEALQLAVDSGLDLTQFDSRNEGIIDALNILYAGQSIYQGELWPHNYFIDLRFGAMRTNLYLLTSLGRNPNELTIGTFCHENGHLLCRFPDMYDYGERDGDDKDSAGIGYYCLMGAGNHLGNGLSPAPVSAYLRDLAGWCNNVVDLNTPSTYQALSGDYGTVMKYRLNNKPNEYFIIENKSRIGLDRACPSSGLVIYHCDIFGSNEFQQGTATKHYQCAVLQADGRRDLENNQNQGDGSDLFASLSGIVVSDISSPNSREWDGRESGLVISDISAPGQTISFTVGQTHSLTPQTIEKEVSPEELIPDAQPAGIASVINVDVSGIVQKLKVKVQISHTFIGDLMLELFSPSGRRALLHSREGGSADNLIVSYDSERLGELSNLVGQPTKGNWILRVSDRAGQDTGRLHKWSLVIESV